jgi:general secretion pathway protein G
VRRPARRSRGFTLIELLVAVAIVGVLTAMVIPMAEVTVQRQREADLRLALREIRNAIDAYKAAGDNGLIEKSLLRNGYPASLQTLVEGVPNVRDPKAPRMVFLRRIPRDPLAPQGVRAPQETWGLRSYASTHEDPQPGDDVYDVYSLAPGKGLNGISFREW